MCVRSLTFAKVPAAGALCLPSSFYSLAQTLRSVLYKSFDKTHFKIARFHINLAVLTFD